jgi:hypothetical protein
VDVQDYYFTFFCFLGGTFPFYRERERERRKINRIAVTYQLLLCSFAEEEEEQRQQQQ